MVSEFRRPVRPELVDNQTEARMGKVRVAGFGVSIDGFGAGPDQGLEHPLGKRGQELMNWFFPTRAFRSMIGRTAGLTTALPKLRWKASAPSSSAAICSGRPAT